MSLSIETIRPAVSEEWDALWEQCDYSTYFHSRDWAEIWMGYTRGGMRPDPRLVLFSDGKKALVPLTHHKRLKRLVGQYVSSPGGTFGGWISGDSLEATHAALLTDWMMNALGNVVWRLNPYDPVLPQLSIRPSRKEETDSLYLAEGFDILFKRWTKGHKSAVTKAQREHISVKLGSLLEDWCSYFEIYEASLQRWGPHVSSRYRWGFFEEMFQKKSDGIKLWLAMLRDRIIAGSVCLYSRNHVVYWHGAALGEFFPLRPVNLLISEAIKSACGSGHLWFDFNPSGHHEGVRAFKRSFGTIALPCAVVTVETRAFQLARMMNPVLKRIVGYDLSLL